MTVESSFLLRLPGEPHYVCIARLALSGFAHQLGMSFDEVCDLKLAVSEACGHILRSAVTPADLEIHCQAGDDRLDVCVRLVPVSVGSTRRLKWFCPELQPSPSGWDGVQMGVHLVEALMDSVSLERESGSGSPVMRMARKLPRRIACDG